MKQLLAVNIRGKRRGWSFVFWGDPKYLDEIERIEKERAKLAALVEDAHILMISGKDIDKVNGLSVEAWLCGYEALKGGK